jgi:hypothetical protein
MISDKLKRLVDQHATKTADEMTQQTVEIANENRDVMQGMSEKEAMRFVEKICTEHELVIGVWPDTSKPHGVGTLIIKGMNKLMEAIMHDIDADIKMSAAACSCREQALALRRKHGDRLDA